MANISPPMRGSVLEAVQEAAHQMAKERALEGKGKEVGGKADSGPSKGKGRTLAASQERAKGRLTAAQERAKERARKTTL